MQSSNQKKFLKETVISNAGASIVAIASLLFVLYASPALADTVYETPQKDSTLTIVKNGTSADSTYGRIQYLEGVPADLDFDRIVFYASSTNSQIQVQFNIFNESNLQYLSGERGTITSQPALIGDTNAYNVTITGNKIGTNKYVAILPVMKRITANQYIGIYYTNPAGNYSAVYDYQDNIGLTVASVPPSSYLHKTGSNVVQLCLLTCGELGTWDGLLSLLDYDDDFFTKFSNVTVTGPKTAVAFNVSYFLNLPEFTVGNRPDSIYVSILNDGAFNDQQIWSSYNLILPLTQGSSTKIITSDYAHAAGNYLANFVFWNIQNNFITFNKTTISVRYTVDNNTVTGYTIQSITTSQSESDSVYTVCESVLDFGCGIKNAIIFLAVPSRTAIDESISSISSSTIPWVAAGYAAYAVSSSYLDAGMSPEATTYELHYDLTAIDPSLDIEVFALSNVVSYISPYAAIPRAVMLTSLIIAFLYMVYQSINNVLSILFIDKRL